MTDKKATLNIEELKAKYGKVYELVATIEEDRDTVFERIFYFKRPTSASYDRFVKSASNSPTKASKTFCLDNIIEEQRDAFASEVEEYPAIAMSLNDKLFSLLGLPKDVTIKKL